MSASAGTQGYRLVKKKWASGAFDGEGAKRYGGRWNSRGKLCVYLAASESLALLEIMVHLQNYRLLAHYSLFQLSLPKAAILRLDTRSLPKNWQDEPAPAETAVLGDDWLQSQKSLALAVPSTVVPREWNYLINPEHRDFSTLITTVQELPFKPDMRLAGPPGSPMQK